MDLAQRFDLRFIVMADRFDSEKYGKRSVEDLKDRYYKICASLAKVSTNKNNCTYKLNITFCFQPTGDKKVLYYDSDHERRRKEQLKRLYDRTPEQVSL